MMKATYEYQFFKKSLSMLILVTVCVGYLKPDLAFAAAQKPEDKATQAETNKRSEQKTTDKRKEIVSFM